VEYLFLTFLAVLYAGTLFLVRRNVRDRLERVEVELLARQAGAVALHQRCAALADVLDDALDKLAVQSDVTDARASLNADSHAEFRNRLDTVESRLDHTVKAVADTFKRAPKRAKRSK
jgi:hypothetical protein